MVMGPRAFGWMQYAQEEEMKKFFILMLIMGAVVIGVMKPGSLPLPDSIPSFQNRSMSGELVSDRMLSDGSVLHFFRSGCAYCLLELPLWVKLKKKYPHVKIIAVLHNESLEEAELFFKSNPNPFDDVIDDTDRTLWESLHVQSTPESFVVFEDKIIAHLGYMRYSTSLLEEKLARIEKSYYG